MEKHDSNSTGAVPRRKVLKSMAGIAAAAAMPSAFSKLAPAETAEIINPKWFGFNLLEYFSTDPDWMSHFPYKNDGMFPEDDFKWIKDWGFNWVRLPMDYRFWTDPKDPLKIDEKGVAPIDRAIKLGEKHGVHVNISLHRAPGECCLDGMDYAATGIRVTPEKTNVYNDQATQDAFVHQWVYFAERYKGISNEKLSFNLVNEPCDGPFTKMDPRAFLI
jgi:endoglucanase